MAAPPPAAPGPLRIGMPPPRSRLEHFLVGLAGEGITGRFVIFATTLTLAMLVISGVVTFVITATILRDRIEDELRHEGDLTAQRIELALDALYLHGQGLAAHTLMANALVDSAGRDLYLRPFLQSDQLAASGATLTLVDYEGKSLAGIGPLAAGGEGRFQGKPWLLDMIRQSRREVSLEPGDNGRARLRLAFPLIYSPTGTAEGALVIETDVEYIADLRPSSGDGSTDAASRAHLQAAGALLTGKPPAGDTLAVVRPLRPRPPLDALGFEVVVSTDRWQAYRPLLDLLLGYVLLGVFGIIATVLLVRRRIARFAEPVQLLATQADAIRRSGRIDLQLGGTGQDELSQLADSFGAMLGRLREARDELERRVEERTRQLDESQRRLSSLLAALPDIVFSLTPDGRRYRYSSDAVRSVLGLDPILPGTSTDVFLNQIHPADLDDVRQRLAGLAATGSAEAVFRAFRTNGEMRWLNTRMTAVRNSRGEIVSFDGITTDITQRKLAEDRLHASEERWELAMRGSNDGIWDWDLTSNRVFFSPRWKAMLGYGDDEIGDDATEWTDRLHPADRERALQALDAHLKRETEFYQTESRQRCRDGSYKWILTRGRALWTERGVPVRIVGSHTDMTERRAFEEAIRERTQQLDTIFSLSPDGFVTIDEAGRIRYANPAFFRMTGLPHGDVIERDWRDFDAELRRICAAPDDYPGLPAFFPHSSPGHADGLPGRQSGMLTLAPPRGTIIEVTGVYGKATAGTRLLYLRDVTREVEVDRMKTDFLSVAAHELRTPMASIFGFTELLLSEEYDAETRRDLLSTVYQQTELLVKIINELLDLSRIEARRGKDFQLEWLHPATLLQETLTALKIDPERWPLQVDAPADIGLVRADPGKLRQALVNVISNATKYSPDGGPVAISLLWREVEGQFGEVGFRVSDHGIGMTADQQKRVFERFYRADTSGRIPGTGLGMSIVKEIVELHGGSIDLESSPGLGTSVTLWLPSRRGGEAAPDPADAGAQEAA